MNNPAADFPIPVPAPDLPVRSRALRALALSIALHLGLLGLLVMLEHRHASLDTAPPTLQIALRHDAAGLPEQDDAPSQPAGEGEQVAATTASSATDTVAAQTPVTGADATPAPATTAQAVPSAPRGAAPAFDGMDLMFLETVRESYLQELNVWLRRQGVLYPPAARERGLEGQVLVTFSLDRDGRLATLRVSRSSGEPLLDEAALDSVRRAAPFPPPPEALPFAVIEDIVLPVQFRLTPAR